MHPGRALEGADRDQRRPGAGNRPEPSAPIRLLVTKCTLEGADGDQRRPGAGNRSQPSAPIRPLVTIRTLDGPWKVPIVPNGDRGRASTLGALGAFRSPKPQARDPGRRSRPRQPNSQRESRGSSVLSRAPAAPQLRPPGPRRTIEAGQRPTSRPHSSATLTIVRGGKGRVLKVGSPGDVGEPRVPEAAPGPLRRRAPRRRTLPAARRVAPRTARTRCAAGTP